MTAENLPTLSQRWQPAVMAAPEPAGAEVTPLRVALRRKWTILGFAAGGAALIGVLVSFLTPLYTSEADVRVEVPQARVVDPNTAIMPSTPPTMEAVFTEAAVLASPVFARTAAVSMRLPELREFQICPKPSLRDTITALGGKLLGHPDPAVAPVCTRSADYAAKVLLGRVSFSAAKDSFIIEIKASDSSPVLAAKIANGYAQAFINWQHDAKARLAQDADDWLTHQLATMHDRMLASDAAVEQYRQDHHLIGMQGGTAGQMSATLRSGQLSQFSQTLGDAMSSLADKRSTLAQVHQAMHDGQYDRVAPALQSPVVQSLLEQHATLAGEYAQLRSTYGPDYPTVLAMAAKLARLDVQTRQEVQRVASGLEAEVAALSARRDAIAAHVSSLEGGVAGESEAGVKLEELEREAATERSVYESLFVRLKQVDTERWFERPNAEIVVEALPPDSPVFPHKQMMVIGGFLTCLGVGTGLAFAQELMSRRFRDADQIEDEVGLPVLGVFAKRAHAPQSLVLDDPHSIEAETLHAVLTQVLGSDAGEAGKTVLVTSALPREGKSCFSVALGRAAAGAGLSAFVLDCDLRHPSVCKLIEEGRTSPIPRPGSVRDPRASIDSADPQEMASALMRQARTDDRSGLRYLQLSDYIANPRGLLAWPGLPVLIAHLRTRCDIVILDAPPVLAVSDSLHLGPSADRVLLLIDWQETPREAAVSAVRALARSGIALTGVVMTKVDLRRFAKTGGTRARYVEQYGNYVNRAA